MRERAYALELREFDDGRPRESSVRCVCADLIHRSRVVVRLKAEREEAELGRGEHNGIIPLQLPGATTTARFVKHPGGECEKGRARKRDVCRAEVSLIETTAAAGPSPAGSWLAARPVAALGPAASRFCVQAYVSLGLG